MGQMSRHSIGIDADYPAFVANSNQVRLGWSRAGGNYRVRAANRGSGCPTFAGCMSRELGSGENGRADEAAANEGKHDFHKNGKR